MAQDPIRIVERAEPDRPGRVRDLAGSSMNADMLAAGWSSGDRFGILHGSRRSPVRLARQATRHFNSRDSRDGSPPPGWVDKHPQSHIHGVEKWIVNRSDG